MVYSQLVYLSKNELFFARSVMIIYTNEEILTFLEAFLSYGLVVSPWLAGVREEARFDVSIYHLLDAAAIDISSKQWTDDVKVEVYGSLPIPDRLARTAVYEVGASTAVSMAHDLTGTNDVSEKIALLALTQMNEYIENFGFGGLIIVYGFITNDINRFRN